MREGMTFAIACVAIAIAGCSSADATSDAASDEAQAATTARFVVTGSESFRSIEYDVAGGGPNFRGTEIYVGHQESKRLPIAFTTAGVEIVPQGINAFVAIVPGAPQPYHMNALLLASGQWRWTVNDGASSLVVTQSNAGAPKQTAPEVVVLVDILVRDTGDQCIGDPPGKHIPIGGQACTPSAPDACCEDALAAAGCVGTTAMVQLPAQPGYEWNVALCPTSSLGSVESIVAEYAAVKPAFAKLDCAGGKAGWVDVLYDPRCTGCSTSYTPQ